MNNPDLKYHYRHYRIPQMLIEARSRGVKGFQGLRVFPQKSAPLPSWLRRYSRKHGFDVPYRETMPCTRGGMTVCFAVENGELIRASVAVCSMSECFCYEEGRNRARDRIETELQCIQDMEYLSYQHKDMVADGKTEKATEITSKMLDILGKIVKNRPDLRRHEDFEALITEDNPWAPTPTS